MRKVSKRDRERKRSIESCEPGLQENQDHTFLRGKTLRGREIGKREGRKDREGKVESRIILKATRMNVNFEYEINQHCVCYQKRKKEREREREDKSLPE